MASGGRPSVPLCDMVSYDAAEPAALKQISDRAISFELADSTRAEPSGAYDAIFCMAVLREPDCPDTVFRKTGK